MATEHRTCGSITRVGTASLAGGYMRWDVLPGECCCCEKGGGSLPMEAALISRLEVLARGKYYDVPGGRECAKAGVGFFWVVFKRG